MQAPLKKRTPTQTMAIMKFVPGNRRAYVGMLAAAASLVAALGYHVICGEHGFLALRREKQQYNVLQKQTTQTQQENDRLQKEIKALKTDPKTIERRAREDSLMAKPGEIIIRYADPKSKTQGQPASTDATPLAPSSAPASSAPASN